jgi:hypothetical protein
LRANTSDEANAMVELTFARRESPDALRVFKGEGQQRRLGNERAVEQC